MIEQIDFSDLGFRRLEPGGAFAAHEADRLAEIARLRTSYEIQSAGDARWIRHRDRRVGPITPLLSEIAAVNASTGDLESGLASLRARDGAWGDLEERYQGSVETCIKLCEPTAGEPLHRMMYFLTSATSLVPRDELLPMLAWHILPAFFRLFPAGHFVVFKVAYQLEARLGMCRSLHRFSQYNASTFAADDISPLQELHAQSSLQMPAIIVDLLSTLTYPWVTAVSAIRPGLLFAFVLDPAPSHVEPSFPGSWSAKLRSAADFAKAPLDLQSFLTEKDPAVRKAASLRRHLLPDPPAGAQTLALLRFTMQRFDRTLWHSTDAAEHCPPGSHVISPLAPFEFGLTLDRALRKGVLAVLGSSEVDRKDDCFEIADLLEELWSQRNAQPGGTSYFKKLFDRSKALELLDRCLADVPTSEWPPIVPAVRAAYDHLVAGIAASVVVRSKIADGGVRVRNRKLDDEVIEPLETFVANVVRALRNAHHGYLTANDSANRPARYLSLVSGHLPEDVSLLAAFWVWAAATSPEVMFDREWIAVGGFEA